MYTKKFISGRGATGNPPSRFDEIEYIPNPVEQPDPGKPATRYFRDDSRTIITSNDSPDVGFNVSINPYRGCEHGCAYCYARPTHEFLGLSPGLDFETSIFVKENADELLRNEISAEKWVPQPIAISGITDCYQPAEQRFGLTRKCISVLAEFRNPVAVVTKNYRVTRDIDLLGEMSSYNASMVAVSITTLDPHLAGRMEPRTSVPSLRIRAIEKLSAANIPVMVLIAPVIPGLNDHEIPAIIQRSADAGAVKAGYIMLRLPYGVKDIFNEWLTLNYPDRKTKILNRIKSVRDGKLNSSKFNDRMSGSGVYALQIRDLFNIACRKHGIYKNEIQLSTANFRKAAEKQLSLL